MGPMETQIEFVLFAVLGCVVLYSLLSLMGWYLSPCHHLVMMSNQLQQPPLHGKC